MAVVGRKYSRAAQPAIEHDEEAEALANSRQWAVIGDGAFLPFGPTEAKLPAGLYQPQYFNGQLGFQGIELVTDDLLCLPGWVVERIVGALEDFWTRREAFRECGYLFKRGVLLWGQPGTGKTALINLVCQQVIEQGGIVVLGAVPTFTSAALSLLRRIEPERRVVHVVEDVERFFSGDDRHEKESLLSLLDGQTQIEGIVHLATTNDPGVADDRIIKRPSRFDEIIEVGPVPTEARAFYLEKRLPAAFRGDIDKWVEDSDGLPISFVREMVVAVCCLGRDYEETLERLREMMKTPKVKPLGVETAAAGF